MTSPRVQANGIGTAMMSYAKKMAKDSDMKVIDIAASHLSAPFFEKFGAKTILEICVIHRDRFNFAISKSLL
ncbi:GNAT family N-acetyltransferase [Pseudoalteromonas sp. P1-26]|uniref:GNAT family N-acetyltransferase n=1 Tax=Pseudoalteromonas sp. P1-26 TaxID=1723759 RepID=UPI0038B60639